MKIALLVEGKTEKAFVPHLRKFLEKDLAGHMPRLDILPYDGHLPTADKLKRIVERLLSDGARAADAVIALTDVYTGDKRFNDAADAKMKLKQWAGNNSKFYPHAAQYEFEAWLLPYWKDIQLMAGHNLAAPAGNPESIDHDNPPSRRIQEIFRTGKRGQAYVKARDVDRILRGKDLDIAASQCSELKLFLRTIVALCVGKTV